MKKTTDKLNLAQKPQVSQKTKKKAISLIFGSIASLVIYYGVGATNIPMLQMGIMVAYMVAFGGLLAAYIIYNRAFSRKNITPDMLPDHWSADEKQNFIRDGEERMKKSQWMLMIIVPLLVTFAAEAMYLFVWEGLIAPMLGGAL